jgi:predicted nucleic acid-binding protein
MVICADTSFLFSLYGNDTHSRGAVSWVAVEGSPITITALNEFELANAMRFSEFRKAIGPGEAALFLADVEADVKAGRLRSAVCNLASVIEEAKRLSSTHTLSEGHRSFDIVHVAAALVLKADLFLTFDLKQKQLAEAEGIQVPF